jgi:hypothetical protein
MKKFKFINDSKISTKQFRIAFALLRNADEPEKIEQDILFFLDVGIGRPSTCFVEGKEFYFSFDILNFNYKPYKTVRFHYRKMLS